MEFLGGIAYSINEMKPTLDDKLFKKRQYALHKIFKTFYEHRNQLKTNMESTEERL